MKVGRIRQRRRKYLLKDMALIPSLSHQCLCHGDDQGWRVENEAPSRSVVFLQACVRNVGVFSVPQFGEVVFWVWKNDLEPW